MYMKKNYKNILIAITFLILGTAIGYIYSEVKNKPTTTIADYQHNVPTNESLNNSNDISDKTVTALPSDSTKSIVPSSTEIVIYNSHAHEDYPSGMKVTDVGSIINDKLIKEGLKSSFIQCNPPEEYVKSYEVTRDLIIENVEDYSK